MKAIIYAGIGLFSVATIYGVADYYSSSKKGTLDKLYAEEEMTVPSPKVDEKTRTVIPVKNARAADKAIAAEVRYNKKVKKHKKAIKMADFSRARIPEEIKEVTVKKPDEHSPEKIKAAPVEKAITERKLSLDMYSRAPLKKMARPAKKESAKD